MEDLRSRIGDPDVRELAGFAVGAPTPERVEGALQNYAGRSNWLLFGTIEDERVVALLGLELVGEGRARIHHIAVTAACRGTGLARALIADAVARLDLTHLTAETDDDSVEFYKRLGFSLRETAARFGRRRYECEVRT